MRKSFPQEPDDDTPASRANARLVQDVLPPAPWRTNDLMEVFDATGEMVCDCGSQLVAEFIAAARNKEASC